MPKYFTRGNIEYFILLGRYFHLFERERQLMLYKNSKGTF